LEGWKPKIDQADAAHSDVSIFLHEVEGRGEDMLHVGVAEEI
jgi:hypothetical protein